MTPLLQSLAGNVLSRRAADLFFGIYARRRVRYVDAQDINHIQTETLLSLVRHAQHTRFGREHDFGRIRTLADYQERVPLRDYDAFWSEYWQPAFPNLADVTWPGPIPYLALSSGTTTGTTKYIPVSPEMLASNRRAAMTSLSWFRAAFPAKSLFTGRMFFLGGSTDLQEHCDGKVLAGDLSGIVAREVPSLLRPYSFPPLDVALMKDWERKLGCLVEQSCTLPITVVSGVPSWLLALFERILQTTGRDKLVDVWPTLQVIVHGGTSFEPYRSRFRRVVGSDAVQFLETYPASEGFVAAEDPRHQLLRLILDHQVFFEFVPVEELGKDNPARHTAADVVPGVQYAVVLTTCAGLWSYILGDTVCFESRDPPLLRFTGRTRAGLSAFGEHLIGEEIERAITAAAEATGAEVVDFHVGPVFPESAGVPGRHRYLVEFAQLPGDLSAFARRLDEMLAKVNEDYAAHRAADLTMLAPEVWPVRRGGFADWMRSRGKLGGQHKLPRVDGSGRLTQEMSEMLQNTKIQAVLAPA
ncbi:MAG TPA: GH3 auxin-responsive promoter family protein [Gemmataceae bacterium]|nr:GH3 auxin-responsive promoter family protein [Gemmataceae bacterium]